MSVDFEELQENGQVNLMEWYQTASEEEKRLADNVARCIWRPASAAFAELNSRVA